MKKMYIEKLRNEKVFILFPSLYDISKRVVKGKIKAIAEFFSKDLFIKLTSNDTNLANKIKEMPFLTNIHFEKMNREYMLKFNLSTVNLGELLDCVDPNATLMEAYAINSLECVSDLNINEDTAAFYMYVSDNDGPFIVFDNTYDFRSTVSSIKTILT